MAIWTVHAPPGADRSAAAADRIRLVRDGFSLWALLLPLPWLLWKRLWLATLAYLLALAAIEVIGRTLGPGAAVVLGIVFALWFALEARTVERWTLGRRGWTLVGIVEGGDAEVAERRFFHAWLTEPAARPVPPPVPPDAAPRPAYRPQPATAGRDVIGLFPTAKGR